MKQLIYIFLCCSLALACKTQKKPVEVTDTGSKIPSKEVRVKATIIDMSYLDGCGFMLELENNERLFAVNMDESWMKEGKKVWITYEASSLPTVCMDGKTVKLKTIEERKE